MTIQKAIEHFKNHQRTSLKKRTQDGYKNLLKRFKSEFSDRDVETVKAEELCRFLETYTEGLARATRRLRYAQLRALFNFIIDTFEINIKNPCCVPQLFKSFKNIQQRPRKILDKETVDEIIFNSKNTRDRLILELQARCGLRVGEVLNLKVSDVSQRKLMLQEPKSGREVEVAFMPEHIAVRLADYIASRNLSPNDRVFGICYTTARNLVTKLGQKLNVRISPHDLRRHSATYASRNGVPLEIISKVILRHQDLKTIQVYLGKVSDSEAIRWMDVLHGK
ncbi:MAG: site-specific integrase [Nitrospirota bacterium]|nr:site-specific integrase [Nitrospirota bacterium]